MKHNEANTYLVLDGMPSVMADNKFWVFAHTTHAWVQQPTSETFDAVYPNFEGWWDKLFAGLPELPTASASP